MAQAQPKQIIAPQAITSTASSYYTSPNEKRTIISKLSFGNSSGQAVPVTVHIVPQGGSPDNTNKIVPGQLIDSDESFSAYTVEGVIMKPGDQIFANTNAAGDGNVSMVASGVEVF